MAWVYILRGGRRYYIGATDNLDRRVAEHQQGSNHTTHRFGAKLELVAAKQLPSMIEARELELQLKRKKNPRLAIFILPRKLSGLVPGSSPGRPTPLKTLFGFWGKVVNVLTDGAAVS
jgi:predicted GIY-YIG superfamily endonuclease